MYYKDVNFVFIIMMMIMLMTLNSVQNTTMALYPGLKMLIADMHKYCSSAS